jgi:putative spermidine/putrescine transport system ATP-binding protein/putrescine transport system ATP-binding protein
MLRLVQLQGFEGRRPGQMSGGQQQRVALARVLATRPKLVLLDEPLSALDAKLREELRLELKQILTAVGSTTIVVTHDQDEAMSLADRIVIMNRGRIEQQGTPDEIYMAPRSAFVAGFIGRTNWFHGRLSGGSSDGFARITTEAGTTLAIRDPGAAGGGKQSVCIRPERMTVTGAGADKSGDNLLPGQVVDVVNMGAELHYIIDAADGRLMVVEPNREGARVRKGDNVSVQFRAQDCVVLPQNAG